MTTWMLVTLFSMVFCIYVNIWWEKREWGFCETYLADTKVPGKANENVKMNTPSSQVGGL